LAPTGRDAVFAGKFASTATIMLVVEALMLPVFLVLFDLNLFSVLFMLTALLATLGFASVGTLFSAIAAHTRAREVMLPLLFLPIALPIIIAAVTGTAATLDGEGWGGTGQWVQFILAFDVVFLVLSSWAFQYVLEE
jgi:heme exporter protein B